MLLECLALAPVPPLLAAACIGGGMLAGRIQGESSERFSSRLALAAATLSLLQILALMAIKSFATLNTPVVLGTWLNSGTYHIDIEFRLDVLSLPLACLFALLAVLVMRFSIHYMHRETGFHRFFMVLSLLVGAMLLLVTAGNAALAFVGWELAGLASYLMIGYHYERPAATANANRAFVTNRIGDAGFMTGLVLAFIWTGGISWDVINVGTARLEVWQAGVLACCFLLAAAAKSALLPFSPWLARAVEGPTPSSAIFYGALMVHAGVYLVLRLEPVFMHAPVAMALMAGLGLATALYGFFCGLVQSDVKSALIFSVTGQIGLMFFAAGLGYWQWAFWHLAAHAAFRGHQFLAAPSLMHRIRLAPARPVHPLLGRSRALYVAALQRLWVENIGDWLLAEPTRQLSDDLAAFDRQIVQAAFGLPAPAANRNGAQSTGGIADPEILCVSGLPGCCVRALALASQWFEEKLVWQGASLDMQARVRKLGVRLNQFEDSLKQPRFLVVFILATLLAVL
jgi:NADH:ubiquinone oxidoreductase subunit 5 (subunit L)/multisubunit Na+/H+ antiporter MnhA subunit